MVSASPKLAAVSSAAAIPGPRPAANRSQARETALDDLTHPRLGQVAPMQYHWPRRASPGVVRDADVPRAASIPEPVDTSGAAYLGDRSRRLRPRSRCCRHRAVCFTPCLTGSSLAAALTGAAAGAPLAAIACAPPEARRAESPPTASFAAGTPRRGRQETPSHVQALATVSGLR